MFDGDSVTWGNPPPFVPTKPKPGKLITPEMISGDSESSHQKALFAWAALSVGKYPQLKWLYHVPNGGLRDARTAANLKAEGVKAGVPDVCLPVGFNASYFGCYIEMKIAQKRNRKNGGLEDDQVIWITGLRDLGYYVAVCYSWQEARDVLVSYLEGKL